MLNETVVVNNPIHLECRASGNPLPGMHTYLGEPEAELIQAFRFYVSFENSKYSDRGVNSVFFKLARNYYMLCIMGNVNIWTDVE